MYIHGEPQVVAPLGSTGLRGLAPAPVRSVDLGLGQGL
jgi:hypothetical protein